MTEKTIKGKKIPDENPDQEAGIKIGFKNPKPPQSGADKKDALWEKVDSAVSVAKKAYQSGNSNFYDAMKSLIAAFQDLLASEEDKGGLGGLGGGPKMDIPPEPEENKEPQ